MNYLELTHKKLDISEINDLVAHESCGAISVFIGTTRDNFEDKKVISLEYEAYDQMAVKAMRTICDEMRAKWDDIANIAIYHRLGLVPVKEASVIIAVSSPHRNTSLDAVQYCIDTLKKLVPIWKKEKYSYPENSSEWKENKESGGCTKRVNPFTTPGPSKKCIRKNLPQLNFENCATKTDITHNLIQITANDAEVERRVKSFIDRKRDEIDLMNIQDFIEKKPAEEDETMTCARVDSIVFKVRDSKGHLKVQRVTNVVGPQNIDYKQELDKLMDKSTTSPMKIRKDVILDATKSGIDERLENVEDIFGLKPVAKNVYERLKDIENKLLYLEGISPEYFSIKPEKEKVVSKTYQKQEYSASDLEKLILSIQARME